MRLRNTDSGVVVDVRDEKAEAMAARGGWEPADKPAPAPAADKPEPKQDPKK